MADELTTPDEVVDAIAFGLEVEVHDGIRWYRWQPNGNVRGPWTHMLAVGCRGRIRTPDPA